MTSAQKVASSLLVSVLAFSIFTVAAFSGLFDFVEVKFYQPAVKRVKEQKLDEIKDAENEYLENLMTRFNIFEMEKDVKTYVDLRPDDISVQKREKLRSALMTETAALLGIRLIDDNGSNIYFSTFDSDKLKKSEKTLSYKNYDSLDEISFEAVKSSDWISENAPSGEKGRVIKDASLNRLIFSFPFYDSKNIFRGTLLFYCDANHFNRYLFSRNLIDVNGFCVLVAAESENPKFEAGFGGYVFGLPNFGRKSAAQQILSEWKENSEKSFWKMTFEGKENGESLLNSERPENSSALKDIPGKTEQKSYFVFSKKFERSDAGFVAAIYDESEFKFPKFLRLLLLISVFITFFLVVFLIFSFKHDDIVVIKSKITSFKKQFVRQYKKMAGIENDSDLDLHKKNLEETIKKSLGRLAVKYEPEFQNLFEKCWNEILLEIEKPYAMIPNDSVVVNKNELREILEDIVSSGKLKVSVSEIQASSVPAIESAADETKQKIINQKEETTKNPEENISPEKKEAEKEENKHYASEKINGAEELESLDADDAKNAEHDTEEIENLETADDESEEEILEDDVGELEPLESSENVDDIDELEPLESADDVDSADEVEPEEVETLESADAVDSTDEVEPKDVGTLESAEIVDDIDDADKAEELESLDADDAKNAEHDAEEIENLETAGDESEEEILEDDVGELEPLESADDVDSADEVEPEEVETLESAEIVDDIDDAEEVEPLENTDDAEKHSAALSDLTAEENFLDDVDKDEAFFKKIDFGTAETKDISPEKLKTEKEIIDNFSTKNLDYGFLDEENSDENETFADDELFEAPEKTQNSACAENQKKIAEDYENRAANTISHGMFSDSEQKTESDAVKNQENLSENSKNYEEKKSGTDNINVPGNNETELAREQDKPAEMLNQNDTEDISALEELESPEETMPFSFIRIAANDTNITELRAEVSDAIVQNSDGTFRIADKSACYSNKGIDLKLKKLVDSVLKN